MPSMHQYAVLCNHGTHIYYKNILAKDWGVPEPIVCHFFIIFFTFVYHLFIISFTFFLSFFYHFVFVFLWLFEIHQILPSVHHIFLIFWSKMLQNTRNPWRNRRKWWEMIKNEKEMIKKWKINDKKMKKSALRKARWAEIQKMQKTSSFFHFFIIFLSFWFRFSVIVWNSSDFAKCSSYFPHFSVENAAKHKKSMKKSKKMMRNDKKWKRNDKKMKNKW